MVDIQPAAAEIRRGKKGKIDRKKPQGKNIMSASATQGGHNQPATARNWATISSTPSHRDNRFSVSSADTDDDHDSQMFQVVRSRRAMKRARQQSSLKSAAGAPETSSEQQTTDCSTVMHLP